MVAFYGAQRRDKRHLSDRRLPCIIAGNTLSCCLSME